MIGMEGRTLHSARLSYRLLEEQDQDALYPILQEPETARPSGFLPLKDREAFERFWQTLTAYRTAVAIVLDGKCIGYLHVHKCTVDAPELVGKKCVMVGFLIGRDYRRRGYATEMLLTMSDYLLERFDCVFADYFLENEASRKTIEKCGFRFLENYEMVFDELGETKQIAANIRTRDDANRSAT